MSKEDLEKIKQSPFLSENAKQIYEKDRERYLKDVVREKEESIDTALSNLDSSFKFSLT